MTRTPLTAGDGRPNSVRQPRSSGIVAFAPSREYDSPRRRSSTKRDRSRQTAQTRRHARSAAGGTRATGVSRALPPVSGAPLLETSTPGVRFRRCRMLLPRARRPLRSWIPRSAPAELKAAIDTLGVSAGSASVHCAASGRGRSLRDVEPTVTLKQVAACAGEAWIRSCTTVAPR